MTKDEFRTQFEDVLKDPTDLIKAGKFRDAVIADYDAHALLSSSTTALQEKNTSLEAENKKLKETNLQLFLMSPAMTTEDKSTATDESKVDENDKPKAPTVDDIVNGLLGNKTEKEK